MSCVTTRPLVDGWPSCSATHRSRPGSSFARATSRSLQTTASCTADRRTIRSRACATSRAVTSTSIVPAACTGCSPVNRTERDMETVAFRHMREGTLADYDLLEKLSVSFLADLPNRILRSLGALDQSGSGYQIT